MPFRNDFLFDHQNYNLQSFHKSYPVCFFCFIYIKPVELLRKPPLALAADRTARRAVGAAPTDPRLEVPTCTMSPYRRADHGAKPYKFRGFEATHEAKPCKFRGFEAIHGAKPCKFIMFEAIHGAKPCKFKRFEAIHGAKHYKFIGFEAIHGAKHYKFIGSEAIHGAKHCKFKGFGAMDGPRPYTFIGLGPMDPVNYRVLRGLPVGRPARR